MGTEQTGATGRERVIALLADHLSTAGMFRWPGSDGLTVDEVVLAAYQSGSNARLLPSPAELAEHHPALAEDIRCYFADVAADVTGRAELRAAVPATNAGRG